MRVRIDAPGKHERAGRIDRRVTATRDRLGEHGDTLAFDKHVGTLGVGGRDNDATSDNRSQKPS